MGEITEDDTFRILKRAPYSDALTAFVRYTQSFNNADHLYNELKLLGWEWQEFLEEYSSRYIPGQAN